jgi:DNA-binding GntR family transcriptional regulator
MRPVLRGILNRLCLQMGPLIAESYHEGGRGMIDNHHAALTAVEPKDADAAERAIVADITEGGNMILERLLGRRAADTTKVG